MNNILLIEDDLSLVNGLTFALKKQGFELAVVPTFDPRQFQSIIVTGKHRCTGIC